MALITSPIAIADTANSISGVISDDYIRHVCAHKNALQGFNICMPESLLLKVLANPALRLGHGWVMSTTGAYENHMSLWKLHEPMRITSPDFTGGLIYATHAVNLDTIAIKKERYLEIRHDICMNAKSNSVVLPWKCQQETDWLWNALD